MREKYLEELLISTAIGALAAHLACQILPYMQETGILAMIVYVIFWILGTTVTWHLICLAQWIKKELPRLRDQRRAKTTNTTILS